MQPDTKSGIAAMDSLISLIDNAGLPLSDKGSDLPKHKCFAYSLSYLTYETNRVIPHFRPIYLSIVNMQ